MQQKMIIGGVILAIWGGLVVAGLTDATSYVQLLRDMLMGLGLYHTALKKPGE
jgi:hypothetical protein